MDINEKVVISIASSVVTFFIGFFVGYGIGKTKTKKSTEENPENEIEDHEDEDLEGEIVNYSEYAKKAQKLAGQYMSDQPIDEWDTVLPLGADGVSRDYPPEEPVNSEKEDIYEITEEDFLETNGYDKITLMYFHGDDTLVDENEEIVPNRLSLVGDCIEKFYEDENKLFDILYVRNDSLACDFEIERENGKFSEFIGL